MLLLMYALCIYTKPLKAGGFKLDKFISNNTVILKYLAKFFTFRIFASIATSSFVLFHNFVKFQDQSSYTQKDSKMNLYYRFI